MLAAVLALLSANSFLSAYYELLLSTLAEVRVGALEMLPLLLWINDGLMAHLLLWWGWKLEEGAAGGELSDRRNIILPGVGAVGGVRPALVYLYFLITAPLLWMAGLYPQPQISHLPWECSPASLAPVSIKIFLTSPRSLTMWALAAIIALFYTANISLPCS